MTYVYKKVETELDAEILRQHRNVCKDFMTRSTSYITEQQQQEEEQAMAQPSFS
jgi:hypothetical protein